LDKKDGKKKEKKKEIRKEIAGLKFETRPDLTFLSVLFRRSMRHAPWTKRPNCVRSKRENPNLGVGVDG
jgi:hypothetical protein